MTSFAQRGIVLLATSLLLPSCGGAVGEAVRPTDQTASGALGKAPVCSGAPKYARPLIVDLDPDSRVDLEASMKRGVTVVAYDCTSIRVLSTCKLPDTGYEFAGTDKRQQVVQMTSMDDLHANMPISSAKVGAELKSGRTIDLALVMIGQRSAPVAKVTKEDLTGDCDGATHVISKATLGAFSMSTGSVGKVGAVAEMFAYGGGAKSESERKAMNQDGSLDSCAQADSEAQNPPSGCKAPLYVELIPVSGAIVSPATQGGKGGKGDKDKDKEEAAAAENPCPSGFLFAGGMCTRDTGKGHLCEPDDEAECKAQCDQKNAGSCYNLGRLVAKKKNLATALPFYKKACDGDYADGCAELGRAMLPDTDLPDVVKQAKDAKAVLDKACNMGSARGCDVLGDLMSEKEYKIQDWSAAVKAWDRGCDLGEGIACWSLSELYFKGEGVAKDADKGLALLNKACMGGSASECNDLAFVYENGRNGVPQDFNKALRANRKACELDVAYCDVAATTALKAGKDTLAFKYASLGCSTDQVNRDEACLILGDLYRDGKGTPADPDKAKAAWVKSCKNGDGDEDACKRIGVKVKD
ncbi:MAG: sel1 repeat family protein [Polyangiaceae bacterium]|nr:sel1 repeat family protein [Polyangiaceae bacterium]